jgi:tripartite-type tricarboxylate transporter receptor subunit TctC
MIVPHAAGTSPDVVARILGEKLGQALGQAIVIDNRGGAGGVTGTDVVAKAAPDGYTILASGSLASAHALSASLPYSTLDDFLPLIPLGLQPLVAVTGPDNGINSLSELVARAKANAGKLNFASTSLGTSTHLSGELFKKMAGLEITTVHYRGSAPALNDMLSGSIDMIFDNIPSIIGQARAGTVRPLAVTSLMRSPVAPEIPALSEFLPGFDVVSWTCLAAPANLPPGMLQRMNQWTKRALESEVLIRGYRDLGAEPWYTSPEEILAYRAAQEARLAPLIRSSGARVE